MPSRACSSPRAQRPSTSGAVPTSPTRSAAWAACCASATAENPETAVALAQRSEAVGLDLVTLRDHPEQPDQLDAWTVLTWIAGQTGRVQLAANVLNLPLRDPAVLARATSLDLLSGGRVEMGLGAGGFWDAIESMGGRRLSAGESIDALEEAITIMRQLWDTSERGEVQPNSIPERVATLPVDLLRRELLVTRAPASQEAALQIVDDIFLPLVQLYGRGGIHDEERLPSS